MDITIEYTDEEKKLFDEVFRLKERIHILEDEAYLLRKAKQEHSMKNHTEGGPPILYLVIVGISLFVFAADLIVGFEYNFIHFAAALGIASCAPIVAVVFIVLFFISYRKYYYQVVKTEEGKRRAKELNIENYYAKEEELNSDYRRVSAELDRLKAEYNDKQQKLDVLVTEKQMTVHKQRDEEIAERKKKEAEERARLEAEGILPKPQEETKEEGFSIKVFDTLENKNEIKKIGSEKKDKEDTEVKETKEVKEIKEIKEIKVTEKDTSIEEKKESGKKDTKKSGQEEKTGD